MSDLNQVTNALDHIFQEEGCRIVFWNDPEREFLDFIDANASLQFGDASVQVLRLDHTSSLAVKIRLEREDPTGRYLLYALTEEPDYENDWLLDGPAGACAQKVTVLNSGERDPQNAFRLYAAFSLVFEGLSTTVRKTSVFLAATKRAISGSKRCQKTRLEINVRKTRGIASF